MAFGNTNGSRRLVSEINVTPLVDVMLVLLIIFMVTAPMMTQGVDVDLPETTAKPLRQKEEPLLVTIKKDGQIYCQWFAGEYDKVHYDSFPSGSLQLIVE